MREIVAFHVMNTPGYRQWLAHHHIQADAANIDSWSQLPPIFANYFKQNLLISRSGEDALELTSSGTSGQKSRMRYDERSIGAAQGMVDRIFRHYGWETPEVPCNYLLLSYEPADIITLGTSFTDQFLCKYAPVKRAVYALRHSGSGHEFDPFGVIRALREFAEKGLPVRILGSRPLCGSYLNGCAKCSFRRSSCILNRWPFSAAAGKRMPTAKSLNPRFTPD
jgi:hypothetical protein